MRINNIFKLVITGGGSELAGVIGSVFTISAIPNWYEGIVKPALNPPSWVVGPVWTTLYALMGIAAWLVWKSGWERKEVKVALGVFGAQLFLNAIWSVIFFGLQNPLFAFVDILFLIAALLLTIGAFWRASRGAALLLLPYLVWVLFAASLNFAIWQLN